MIYTHACILYLTFTGTLGGYYLNMRSAVRCIVRLDFDYVETLVLEN